MGSPFVASFIVLAFSLPMANAQQIGRYESNLASIMTLDRPVANPPTRSRTSVSFTFDRFTGSFKVCDYKFGIAQPHCVLTKPVDPGSTSPRFEIFKPFASYTYGGISDAINLNLLHITFTDTTSGEIMVLRVNGEYGDDGFLTTAVAPHQF